MIDNERIEAAIGTLGGLIMDFTEAVDGLSAVRDLLYEIQDRDKQFKEFDRIVRKSMSESMGLSLELLEAPTGLVTIERETVNKLLKYINTCIECEIDDPRHGGRASNPLILFRAALTNAVGGV